LGETPRAFLQVKQVRTFVYVDGFNLFYGALKGTPYKWLDIRSAISRLLRSQNKIIAVKYFTARVRPSIVDTSKHVRQDAYLKALDFYHPFRYSVWEILPVSVRKKEVWFPIVIHLGIIIFYKTSCSAYQEQSHQLIPIF
jgi:hypothetical protein